MTAFWVSLGFALCVLLLLLSDMAFNKFTIKCTAVKQITAQIKYQ
jgi:membrane protein implicated in regulation of membrane protease activity